jgi:hypothetical protein
VANIEHRLAMLSGRASKEAWTHLYRLRHHPKFASLLTELEKIPGTIMPAHVEQTAQNFLDADD